MTHTEAVERKVPSFEQPELREWLGQRCQLSEGPRTPRRYDWAQIKTRYVEGVPDGNGSLLWPSLSEVADHFGTGVQRLKEKSSMEGWVAQRTAYQNRIERARQQARVARLAREGAVVDDRALEAAKTGLQLCLVALSEQAQAAQRRRTETLEEGMVSGIDALELQRIASAVDAFHKIGGRATGGADAVAHREIEGTAGPKRDIRAELRRDDPTRLAGVLAVLAEAGLGDHFGVATERGRRLEKRHGAP